MALQHWTVNQASWFQYQLRVTLGKSLYLPLPQVPYLDCKLIDAAVFLILSFKDNIDIVNCLNNQIQLGFIKTGFNIKAEVNPYIYQFQKSV